LHLARFVFAIVAAASAAQQPAPAGSVWDGVFAATQADRGRTVFLNRCARCHGEDTANSNNPLAGDRFAEHWESRTLADLFHRIRDTMPPGGESILVADSDKLDAMAYLLQANGFPDGPRPLAADDAALATFRITRRNGPGPLRTGTLVRAAGCLAQRGEREWQLTRANEPQRTTLDPPSGGAPGSPSTDPGTRTIVLVNAFPSPAPYAGHRMAVVGFLVRNADGDAINVVSLEPTAEGCTP
jgi:mono/diheme cytochrome c family protein